MNTQSSQTKVMVEPCIDSCFAHFAYWSGVYVHIDGMSGCLYTVYSSTTLVVTVKADRETAYSTDCCYIDKEETTAHAHHAYDTIQTSIYVFVQVCTLIKCMNVYHFTV